MHKKFHSKRRLFAVFIAAVALCSCATPGAVRTKEMAYPLRVLQAVADKSLPVGRRHVSRNAREFYSEYFIPKGPPKFWQKPQKNTKVRYYSVIKVLGDRRPYIVEVSVVVEKLQRSEPNSRLKYEKVETHSGLAQEVLKYFRENLSKSLKDRNVIDDFRVF